MASTQNSRIRWLLIWWMFLVSAIAYLDRVNISIAGQAIANEFHLDNVHLGWVFSAFVLGYALFQAPGGSLADKIGPRRVLAGGVVWWGLFTAIITFLPVGAKSALLFLIAARFLLGMGEAVVYPASNCVVAAWIPSTERGIANGIIFAGVGFGAGITPPLIGYLMLHQGWRASFWASAILGLIAGVIWYAFARDKPAEHPRVSASERAFIQAGLPNAGEAGSQNTKLPWTRILRDHNVQAITFSYFTYGYAAYIFFSWFFIYLSSVRKLDVRASSYYTMLPFLAMAVGSPLGGWISDRLTKKWGKRVGRCFLACAAILVCAGFVGFAMRVESPRLASLVLAGGAGALYLSQSSFWSVSADIGKASAGSVSGFMNMGGQLGGALTASLTPAIANRFGWTASFIVAASLCAAGALAWLPVRPEPVTRNVSVAA
ncbi:MAG: MFS transporter [Acidobacteriaceae bacterium]|nr:MFS transporter [Acidobacteriaceae bacterium]MBV9780360.1 MFS transporter [Acidobacteriaceae bacterium]